MLRSLIDTITKLMCENDIIEKKDIDIYSYGLELLLNNIITVLLLFLIGFFLGAVGSTIIFTGIFISLKRYTGGFHCSTYGKCLVLTFLVYLLVVVPSMILTKEIQLIIGIVSLIYSVIYIYLSNPLASNSRPKTSQQVEECNKQKNNILVFILGIQMILLILGQDYTIFFVISNSLMAIAINMMIEKRINLISMKSN